MTYLEEDSNTSEYVLRLPINFTLANCTYPRPARLLAYYEDFKVMSDSSGLISKLKVTSISTYRKWMAILVEQGIAFKVHNGYRLRSRQYLWNWLGIDKVWIKKLEKERYRYVKITVDHPLDRSGYIKKLIEYFERYSIQRKLNQCYYKQKRSVQGLYKGDRFRKKKSKLNTPLGMILFSGNRFSKLTGHKSESTGLRKRRKYCNVIQQPKLVVNKFTGYSYTCAGIDVVLKRQCTI